MKYIEKMSHGLLGMDIGASYAVADALAAWTGIAEDARASVTQAEVLAEIHSCDIAIIDEIGDDGAAMAAAIRRAADALSSFHIQLVSPAPIVAAVGAVHSFRGGDNDPELDRRLRTLRSLIDAATESDEHANSVMQSLLAAGDSAEVATAMADVQRLSAAESSGAISHNDHRIDSAIMSLRRALAHHAMSREHLDYLTAAFLADKNQTPAATLLASLLTGQSATTVQVAHTYGWDYEVAAGWLATRAVDRLTTAIRTAPLPEIAELERQRSALLSGLSGTTDPQALADLARRADSGTPAIEVVPAQMRDVQVSVVADEFGLDEHGAGLMLDYMTTSTDALVAAGYRLEDAAIVVSAAAHNDRDIAPIVELASEEGLPLLAAFAKLDRAEQLGMSLEEFDAFAGLVQYFSFFDTVRGGSADGVVSLADLRFVVNNYAPGRENVMQAAAAILRHVDLRHRIDSAAATGAVVGREPFGRDRAADHKYSLADIALLIEKQETNYALRGVVDQIDVAGNGGALGWVDGNLSEFDFEHVRAHHQAYGLTPAEVQAIDVVLANDWYAPTFWQEHGDSFIMGAAVVAGILAGAATAGVGSGIAGVLISAAAGATAGATTGASLTVVENALTGDPLTEDVAENTVRAAAAGIAGAGVHGYLSTAGRSLAVRLVHVVGPTADTAGLISLGMLDPAFEVIADDVEIGALHQGFQWVNYSVGAGAVAGQLPVGEMLGEALVRAGGVGLDQLAVELSDD